MDSTPKPANGPSPAAETTTSLPIRYLEFKVAMLLALTLVLSVAFVGYVLYARGVFESTQKVILVTESSDGVNVGMPVTFRGFSIGRVRSIALGEDAMVRIEVAVPKKDTRWLRQSNVFIIERALVGGVGIRAATVQLDSPPLPDGAVCTSQAPGSGVACTVLRADSTEEIPHLVTTVRDLLVNVQKITAADSNLEASLANLRVFTERMSGRGGLLAGTLGSEENAAKVVAALDRANRLLDSLAAASGRLDQILVKADQVMVKADQRVFGREGVMDETQRAVGQFNAVLGDARESLKKVDAVLADAQKISASAKGATDDLAGLRAEVDASVRKIGALIDEINRKWPFKRDTEVKLP